MTEFNKRLSRIGLRLPEMLLPGPHVNLEKWPVVACDQFTSKPVYWEELDELVSKTPSTRHLIYPECYLGASDCEDRIDRIHEAMDEYLSSDVFVTYEPGLHLIVRSLPGKPERTGLMIAIDLEEYDYSPNSVSPIRPTEGTIVDRIPARKAVRAGASLELPHVMVLIDDPGRTIIEPMKDLLTKSSPVYTTRLMKGGGSVAAYRSQSPELAEQLVAAFELVADPVGFERRYQTDHPFFIAVGDGNHSLAAAKSMWEDMKSGLSASSRSTHPARFALVEAINLYDEGIIFEPIHRLLFGIDSKDFVDFCCRRRGTEFSRRATTDDTAGALTNNARGTAVGLISDSVCGILKLATEETSGAAELVQNVVDEYLELAGGTVDYIHDMETVLETGMAPRNAGLLMPGLAKAQFFPYIISHGCYPRKSFSLGESTEKRYYMEARRITY